MANILDALAIGAAGVGRGIRAGQETQRQIAEARRKALMDEQELELKKRLALSQMGLESAQGENLKAQALGTTGTENRAQGAYTRATTPITGTPPAGYPQGAPYTPENIDRYSDILNTTTTGQYGLKRQALENQGGLAEIGARNRFSVEHPELAGGRSRVPQTPDERLGDYWEKILGTPQQLGQSPEEYAAGLRAKLNFLLENDPEVSNLINKRKGTSSNSNAKSTPNTSKVKPASKPYVAPLGYLSDGTPIYKREQGTIRVPETDRFTGR